MVGVMVYVIFLGFKLSMILHFEFKKLMHITKNDIKIWTPDSLIDAIHAMTILELKRLQFGWLGSMHHQAYALKLTQLCAHKILRTIEKLHVHKPHLFLTSQALL